mmetsp:Transcript_89409/g.154676  ORF Transcript_89409/g.154676 Transcript_89409/m.154676 type:complete len:184 (-) Transcript_89409:149-700(-)
MGQCGCSSCFAFFVAQRRPEEAQHATPLRTASDQITRAASLRIASTGSTLSENTKRQIELMEAGNGAFSDATPLRTLSANTMWQLKFMETGEASPTSVAQTQSLLDEIENQQHSIAVQDSKITGGIRKCFICGDETRGGLKSQTHPDCPHVACSLEHMLRMEVQWVGIRHELAEGDKMLSGCE